jgi:alpha-galactosidase
VNRILKSGETGTLSKPYFRLVLCLLFTLFFVCNAGCEKNKGPVDNTGSIKFADVKLNTIQFKTILVLGNSITKCPPQPNIGWYSNWGMAASSEDKDYVHVLEKKYKEINPKVVITPVNIADWEGSHANYDLSKLDAYFENTPDLVIIRLGENVTDASNFTNSLTRLINYAKQKSPATKFMISGLFWQKGLVEDQLQIFASANNIPFVKISILNTPANRTYFGAKVKDLNGGSYEIRNPDIVSHPGDAGMEKLAMLLYNELVEYDFK